MPDDFKAGEDKGRILGAIELLDVKISYLNEKISGIDCTFREFKQGSGERLGILEKVVTRHSWLLVIIFLALGSVIPELRKFFKFLFMLAM